MLGLLGPILGAATNLFGMKMAGDEADDARGHQWAMQQHNDQMQREFWEKNAALQREFAQSGIQWRTADAKAAGIHPLFAMGGGGAAASGSAYVPGDTQPVRDNSHQYLSNMGQDISRALTATMQRKDRNAEILSQLGLERAQLENELLKSQIAKTTGMIGPPMPSQTKSSNAFGDAAYGNWEPAPHEVTTAFPGSPHSAAGDARPYTQWNHTGTGLLSSPVKDSNIEVDELSSPLGLEWVVKNRVTPFLGYKDRKPPLELMQKHFGQGVTDSRFSMGEWKPVYGNTRSSVTVPLYRNSPDRYRHVAPGRRPSYGPSRTYYGSEGF